MIRTQFDLFPDHPHKEVDLPSPALTELYHRPFPPPEERFAAQHSTVIQCMISRYRSRDSYSHTGAVMLAPSLTYNCSSTCFAFAIW